MNSVATPRFAIRELTPTANSNNAAPRLKRLPVCERISPFHKHHCSNANSEKLPALLRVRDRFLCCRDDVVDGKAEVLHHDFHGSRHSEGPHTQHDSRASGITLPADR